MSAIKMIQKQMNTKCSFLQKLILLFVFFMTIAAVQGGDISNEEEVRSLHNHNDRPTMSDNEVVNIFGKGKENFYIRTEMLFDTDPVAICFSQCFQL